MVFNYIYCPICGNLHGQSNNWPRICKNCHSVQDYVTKLSTLKVKHLLVYLDTYTSPITIPTEEFCYSCGHKNKDKYEIVTDYHQQKILGLLCKDCHLGVKTLRKLKTENSVVQTNVLAKLIFL